LRHRRLIVGLSIAFGVVAILVTVLSPRQYTASAKFSPQERNPAQEAGGLGALASQLGVGSNRIGTSSPQFYSDLLVSREILRDLVRMKYDVPGDKPFSGDLVAYLGIQGVDRDDATSRAVTAVRALITTLADRNGVVSVDFHSDSPSLSLQVVSR